MGSERVESLFCRTRTDFPGAEGDDDSITKCVYGNDGLANPEASPRELLIFSLCKGRRLAMALIQRRDIDLMRLVDGKAADKLRLPLRAAYRHRLGILAARLVIPLFWVILAEPKLQAAGDMFDVPSIAGRADTPAGPSHDTGNRMLALAGHNMAMGMGW